VNHCCKIRARAADFLAGRLDLFLAALEFQKLATWTRLEADHDLRIFAALLSESSHLPIGPERAHWAAEALARKDPEIQAIRGRWVELATKAAENLERRFAWALARRAELARLGVRGPVSKAE
jgi:hypothetical protein